MKKRKPDTRLVPKPRSKPKRKRKPRAAPRMAPLPRCLSHTIGRVGLKVFCVECDKDFTASEIYDEWIFMVEFADRTHRRCMRALASASESCEELTRSKGLPRAQ